MIYVEKCPILGERQWSMDNCKVCDGSGRAVYHSGCCDTSPGDCQTCDGSGYVNVKARWIYTDGRGPWVTDTDNM